MGKRGKSAERGTMGASTHSRADGRKCRSTVAAAAYAAGIVKGAIKTLRNGYQSSFNQQLADTLDEAYDVLMARVRETMKDLPGGCAR